MHERNHAELIKGIAIGLATGCVLKMALGAEGRRRKKCKNHTIRAIGDVVGNVTEMLGY